MGTGFSRADLCELPRAFAPALDDLQRAAWTLQATLLALQTEWVMLLPDGTAVAERHPRTLLWRLGIQ